MAASTYLCLLELEPLEELSLPLLPEEPLLPLPEEPVLPLEEEDEGLLLDPEEPWPELPLPDAVPCKPGEPAPEELVLLPEESEDPEDPEDPEVLAPVWPLLPWPLRRPERHLLKSSENLL